MREGYAEIALQCLRRGRSIVDEITIIPVVGGNCLLAPNMIEITPYQFGERITVDPARQEITIRLVLFGRPVLMLRRIPFSHVARIAPLRMDRELHSTAAAFTGLGSIFSFVLGLPSLARLLFIMNRRTDAREGYSYDLRITTKDGDTFSIARVTQAWDEADPEDGRLAGMSLLEKRLRDMIGLSEFY